MSEQADIQELRKRYTADVVPPCRVCGEPLSLQAFGGGRAAEWGCDGYEPEPDATGRLRRKQGRSIADEHYTRSTWTQYRGGDADVLKALDELERRRALDPSAIVAALEKERDAARARARDNGLGDVWTALDVGMETGIKKAIDIVKELTK